MGAWAGEMKNEKRNVKRKAEGKKRTAGPSAFGPRDAQGPRRQQRRRIRATETAPMRRLAFPGTLEGGEVLVEVGYGFDAAEIVFQGEVLVGGVGVFVGETETQ